MVGPGPTQQEMETILRIAARTPDHGGLAPWRFVTVSSDQREDLAALLLDALDEANEASTQAHREKEVSFAHYPGQLVVLVSATTANHKIPEWEQQLSCGAAGMNLLMAAHALGYVGGWVTGRRAYSERVRKAFCGAGERVAGFIFLGHPDRDLEDRPRPSLGSVVRAWQSRSA